MEKRKQQPRLLQFINLNQHRAFEFTAPFNLHQCQKRLKNAGLGQITAQDEDDPVHYEILHDTGKNWFFVLHVYMAGMAEGETQVYGEVYLHSTVVALLLIPLVISIFTMIMVIAVLGVWGLLMLSFYGIFWGVSVLGRNQLLHKMHTALGAEKEKRE